MPSPSSRRLPRRGLIALVVVLVIAGGVVAYVLSHSPGNVSNPNLQFTRPPTTAPKPHKPANNFQWPWYGFDAARTRFFAASGTQLHPPLHVGWRFDARALLEFPPVIYHSSLFMLDDNGYARAINTLNGHVRWTRRIGTLAAASPAVAAQDQILVMPVLSEHGHSPGGGRFVGISMTTGHVLWSHPEPSGTESSPIVRSHTAYYGDQAGVLTAIDVRSGHVGWTYHASGPIKGGPALVAGKLYFGDYAGRAYAVSADNGRQVWAVGTSGTRFGFGSGNFYATPAVAFGRVYMGNTDGRVYSFGARTGALAWATGTGAYVYASASVADTPGLGPTLYVGSYDGNFYAFNAQSGAVRWKHAAGGRISGSSTVIDNTVYFSDLGSKTTTGLNATTGRPVFSFPDGAFTPAIADYHSIYLAGYGVLYQMLPGGPPHAQAHRSAAGHPRTRAGRKHK